MYKIAKEHEEIQWIKLPRLRSDLKLEVPSKGVRENRLIILRETFKTRKIFSHPVTIRHNYKSQLLSEPIWDKLPVHVVYSRSLN